MINDSLCLNVPFELFWDVSIPGVRMYLSQFHRNRKVEVHLLFYLQEAYVFYMGEKLREKIPDVLKILFEAHYFHFRARGA